MPRLGTPRKLGVKARYANAEFQTISPLSGTGPLTEQQRLFAEAYAASGNKKQSAIKAGYSEHSAGQRASQCLQHPLVIQYLQSLRAESRAIAAYDVSSAMQEAMDDHKFAVDKGNPMAAVKATELRAKLSGLLIDRVEIATVDLTGALQRAEQRVFGQPALTQTVQAEPQAEPHNRVNPESL